MIKASFFLNFFLVGLSLPIVIYAFDYYIFSNTWRPEFCRLNPSKCVSNKIQPFFSIHGLWPQNNNGSYPSFCKPCEEFSLQKISQLKNKLLQYWSDTQKSIDYTFLQHEWEKHGCCSNLSLINYFNQSLELAIKWNFLKVWNSIDLFPTLFSNNKTIQTNLLQETAKDFCGNKCDFIINCDQNQYLSGYYITLNKNLDVYNNSTLKTNCNQNIIWGY